MKHLRFTLRKGGSSRLGKVVGVAAVLLVGLLGFLAADPEAHEFFHTDAGQCDHECVVTAFAAGEGLSVVPPIEIRPTSVVVQRVHFEARESLVESPGYLLLPICGPPSAA
jgi:hypothetical protein